MPPSQSRLEELLAARKHERDEAQRTHLRLMAEKAEAELGTRVIEAISHTPGAPWEQNGTSALRRFRFRNGDYQLELTAILGAPRVELELRHADPRFKALAKKAAPGDFTEDWFLNALEMLATQIQDRLVNPKNFV
jgi:hypothetical protein